jgi:hypothetical protein
MTISRRLQMKAALVLLLGSLAFRSQPRAATVNGCFENCLEAVWNIHCPSGMYVRCVYSSSECGFAEVYGYCEWDS